MKAYHPVVLFFYLAFFLIFALLFLQMLEPETKLECINAKVVDAYRTKDGDNILAVDAGTFVEKLSISDTDFYHHVIGETTTICNYRKTYTHLPVGYELEH